MNCTYGCAAYCMPYTGVGFLGNWMYTSMLSLFNRAALVALNVRRVFDVQPPKSSRPLISPLAVECCGLSLASDAIVERRRTTVDRRETPCSAVSRSPGAAIYCPIDHCSIHRRPD